MAKIKVLVGCQNDECAAEVSHYLEDVRMWKGEPVCQDCYDEDALGMTEEQYESRTLWCELLPVTLRDLRE